MGTETVLHRGWTIEVSWPGGVWDARVYRPGSATAEKARFRAPSREAVLGNARRFIDGRIGPEVP
jgi:hypothetical protein